MTSDSPVLDTFTIAVSRQLLCKLVRVRQPISNATSSLTKRGAVSVRTAIIGLIFFASGVAALVYEVLWMRELGLLFGNSTQAAAATLAAFFAGIASGNAYWGKRSAKLDRPLRAYGLLELGVLASAVLYFAILGAYSTVYSALFDMLIDVPAVFVLIKFSMAFLLFFPSAFFMGGTLPVMTQYFVRDRQNLGRYASTLYAINTFGAASGAFAAGLFLIPWLGVNTSYVGAMAATLLVAAIAFGLDRREGKEPAPETHAAPASKGKNRKAAPKNQRLKTATGLNWPTLWLLAGLSGFTALALQVLWIRMFAQVLHNSVYSYATILAIFLLALALGGAIARRLAGHAVEANRLLTLLLVACGLSVAASPFVFQFLTDGGSYITGDADFSGYMVQIVLLVAIVIGPPVIVMGILLPSLFKLAEARETAPGETVGRLVTANTLASIVGSVFAGFLFLDLFGLWASVMLLAGLYLAAAIWLGSVKSSQAWPVRSAPVASVVLMLTFMNSSGFPVVSVDPDRKETLLKVWEGSDGTVAVIRRNGHLRTKLNNWYSLGSTDDVLTQQIQSHLPLLLHPNPKRVFYLGLGTGITAGTSLNYPVEELTVAEIAPSVIKASRGYFDDYTNNLFGDARASVVAEDGRNVLRGTGEQYDLIISDLFIPWKAGTGSLYSVEHYENAKRRLADGGLYAQWLPLYQLTSEEFAVIARSMLEVFPVVTMWRGNFQTESAVVALVGHQSKEGLDRDVRLMAASRQVMQGYRRGQGETLPLITHYAGHITSGHPLVAGAPLNTDNRPVIDYQAPINHRRQKAGDIDWFTGARMLDFMASHVAQDVLSKDPYISSIDPAWQDAVLAGYYFHAYLALRQRGNKEDGEAAREAYQRLMQQAASKLSQEN